MRYVSYGDRYVKVYDNGLRRRPGLASYGDLVHVHTNQVSVGDVFMTSMNTVSEGGRVWPPTETVTMHSYVTVSAVHTPIHPWVHRTSAALGVSVHVRQRCKRTLPPCK